MTAGSFRRRLAVALTATFTAALATALPATAAPYQVPEPEQERVVEGASQPLVDDAPATTGTPFTAPAPVWPEAGVAEAGGGAERSLDRSVRAASSAGRATIETFDRARTEAAGVDGVLLRVKGSAKVEVDYSKFRWAYGGDWASRLKLVKLPECALSTPDKTGCGGEQVPSRNDLRRGVVTATESTPEAGTLMALTAGTSSGSGTYSATSLNPSSTWSTSGNTGEFTWNYPMRVPPALGGPAPSLELNYSSSNVDGRMAASNNQPSWAGEGFEFASGFIERRYVACSDDMANGARNTVKTGDLCWATDNATLSMSGHAGELIKAGDDSWRLRDDDGTRVERRHGLANGARDGEHWVVTTPDGTQHWFGRSTQSTLVVPVAGNHVSEPCAATAFAGSFCQQGYRWNLEHVVDLHGNTMTYTWAKETNKYGRNKSTTDLAGYDRASHLQRIDYGTRTDRSEDPPMQVVFDTADRCLANCGSRTANEWPDVPWDRECTASPCTVASPTFWSTKRLATVTTKVGGRNVEKWTFSHSFPDPGDGTRAGLWLERISHEGLVGESTTVPDITFQGIQLSNRVDTHSDQHAAMKWWRIASITTETGGKIDIDYSEHDCVPGSRMPNPAALHDNHLRCYPVRWTPEGNQDPILDYFHKYVVTSVLETDMTGGSTAVPTTYEYVGDPAWRYTDDDGLVRPEDKTWSVWRGYDTVRVTKGRDAERTYTETRYFRGMHGDKRPSGTHDVRLPAVGAVPEALDEDTFAGTPRQETVYNGPGGTEVSSTVTELWQSPPTASRTINNTTVHAHHTGTKATHTRTTLDAGRGHRSTSTHTTFDDAYGDPIRVENRGDDAVAGDEKCEITDYVRNTTTRYVSAVSRKRVYTLDCTAAQGDAVPAAELIGDTSTYYDGQDFGVPPVKGDITQTRSLKSNTNGVLSYHVDTATEYDAYGRATKATTLPGTALARTTSTTYTPTAGGPVTQVATTNPLGWVSTEALEPAWGSSVASIDPNQRRTELAHDGLGRVTAVWKPDRTKGTHTPNIKFSYLVRRTGVVVVTTETLNPQGGYTKSYQHLDSLLRPRQTQNLDPAGSLNAVVIDTLYDSVGRAAGTNQAYLGRTPPGTELYNPSQHEPVEVIPRRTVTTYDGAGRVVEEALYRNAPVASPGGELVSRTTTAYAGDRVDVTPPTGGVVTSTLTDARGRKTELRQYKAGFAAGSSTGFDAVEYTYDEQDRLKTVKDAGGNRWSYDYDVLGRQIRIDDPDKGVTTSTYDNAGQLTSTTDARNITLAYTYDALGRKTSVRDGSPTGAKRAEWVYDTLSTGDPVKGLLVKSIRYQGADAYVKETVTVQQDYKPIATKVVIPASETGLSGTYEYLNFYNTDGSLDSTTIPEVGNLRHEVLRYQYNAFGQPTTVRSGYGTSTETDLVTETKYTSFGELASYTLQNNGLNTVSVLRQYDQSTRRLTQLWTSKQTGPTDVAKVDYSYDAFGNVTKVADTVNGDTQCFRTDHVQRLTEAWTPASGDCAPDPTATGLGGPAKYWQSFTYNAEGDRASQVDHATTAGDRTTTYTPAAGSHRVSGTSTTDSAGTRTATYGYDSAGNTTTRPSATGVQTLVWNAEGRLDSVSDTSGQSSYVYDADGGRLIRRDPAGRTLYLPGQEARVSTAGVKTGTRYFSHAGQTIAMRTSAGITWITSDHHGTAEITISNRLAQTVAIRRTLPFGDVRGNTGTWPTTLDKGFVGGTLDNTGLTHIGAREYDPILGRFISVDPVMDLADPQQMHGYAYANNSPLTFSDPTGLIRACGVDGAGCGAKNYDKSNAFNPVTYVLNRTIKKPAPKFRVNYRHAIRKSGLERSLGNFVNFADGLVGAVNPLSPWINPRKVGEGIAGALTGRNRSIVDENSNYHIAGSLAAAIVPGGMLSGLTKAGLRGLFGHAAEEVPVRIYRATDHYLDNRIAQETGHMMSDAARIAFMESGESLAAALAASQRAHVANVSSWGDETLYALAHAEFGTDLSQIGVRSMISFTTDLNVASRFGGSVYSALIKPSEGIWQTLPGSSEAEVLIRHMIKVVPWPR